MGLYSETNKTARIIVASLAMMAATAQLPPAFSGESAEAARSIKTKSPGPTTSSTASQQSEPAFRARIKSMNPASGTWSRTPSRSAVLWTSSQVESKKQSNIRVVSVSGIDEGVTSTVDLSTSQESNDPAEPADESLAAAADPNATTAETPPPVASSASVKEQLLHALRMQRKAITNPNALHPTTPAGSLTIMNSPKVTPKSTAESTKLAAPQALVPSLTGSSVLSNQSDLAAETHESVIQPKTSKSYAGLTRTLEEDLKSDDAYLRERAKRFLRLQMQLLQLRSRQAAAAETARQMSMNYAGDTSIPVKPDSTGGATQSLVPLGTTATGSNPGAGDQKNSQQQPSDHSTSNQNSNNPNLSNSDQQTQPDETLSEESNQAPSEPSANASLLENVVVDGPIDRLGLANNLFAVGEYPLALEMYQQATGVELSSQQQYWVEYQIASCLHHLGNPAEASNQFRKLAGKPEAGWLSQQAHWWVETLESIRILEKALEDNSVEQSREVIENVEAEVVAPAAENRKTSTVSESTRNLEPAKDEHIN